MSSYFSWAIICCFVLHDKSGQFDDTVTGVGRGENNKYCVPQITTTHAQKHKSGRLYDRATRCKAVYT